MAQSITVKTGRISGTDLRRLLAEASERRHAILADPEALQALHVLHDKGIERSDLLAAYSSLSSEGAVS
jgi:hypothetical protein